MSPALSPLIWDAALCSHSQFTDLAYLIAALFPKSPALLEQALSGVPVPLSLSRAELGPCFTGKAVRPVLLSKASERGGGVWISLGGYHLGEEKVWAFSNLGGDKRELGAGLGGRNFGS